MAFFRRVYFYAVAFISLETVVWGAISLLRALISRQTLDTQRLASALALIAVGAPVFGLHWWLAQRDRARSPQEAFSRTRAVFLYGVLLVALMPALQNALALLDRLFLTLLNAPSAEALIGADQTWGDNLVALAINAAVGAYFWRITRQDWEKVPQGDAYPETRRLYWYIWLFYALAALLGGGANLVGWLARALLAQAEPALLANGLSALLVGGALWVFMRRLIRRSLADPAERESLLRLSTLFLITFMSLAGLLLATWIVLSESLEALFSGGTNLRLFLLNMADPLSVGIPTGLMFAYYRRLLGLEMHSQPISLEAALRVEPEAGDENPAAQKQKRAALTRLYFYTLALIGLTLALSGLQGALRIFIEMLTVGFSDWQSELSLGLAAALIGAPLWFYAWRPLQKEAGRSGEPGDHTRRSPIRRGYLYLVLFAGVIGAMFSAGWLLYQAIGWLLGAPSFDLAFGLLNGAKNLLLYTALLLYHGRVLGQDNRQAERALAQRHAQYSVLLLSPDPPADESGRQPNGAFTREIVAALQRYTPALPVAVHPYRAGIPNETLSAARAVIVPGELLARQSEAWRLWLQAFPGELLVAPTETPRWRWIDGGGAPAALARRIAALVRRLAEGEGGINDFNNSSWLPLAYTAAGVFVLALILVILVAGLSMFQV